jgi:hypothetical protein
MRRFPKCEKGESAKVTQYIYNLGLCLSQILSTILGGDPDESVSSRTGKAIRADIWYFKHMQGPFIDWFIGAENHCLDSIEDDEGKKGLWNWVKQTLGVSK